MIVVVVVVVGDDGGDDDRVVVGALKPLTSIVRLTTKTIRISYYL